MAKCVVCGGSADSNVCAECAGELACPLPFVTEQVLSAWARPLDATLIDTWGRVHRLEAKTSVGRQPSARGVSIFHGSVSRRHAELSLESDGWRVTDVGSRNGTRVNDDLITSPTRLTKGDRIAFGEVGFYFAIDDGTLVDVDLYHVASRTLRSGEAAGVELPRMGTDRGAVVGEGDKEGDKESDDDAPGGLPTISMRLVEAPSGGGGYLQIAKHELKLTDTQFALMLVLARKMSSEVEVAPVVRGFVPSTHLLVDLPWDTSSPSENHLKQLVRRVRAVLDQASLSTLIESRRGFGYRLRAIPRGTFEVGGQRSDTIPPPARG